MRLKSDSTSEDQNSATALRVMHTSCRVMLLDGTGTIAATPAAAAAPTTR